MEQSVPRISVIIPTLNGGDVFRELLEKLSSQSITPDELLVVDSSSNDNTQAVAEEFGARVISIPKSEFDHGATRSMAAQQAVGSLLLFFYKLPRNICLKLLNILRPVFGFHSKCSVHCFQEVTVIA